MPTKQAIPAVPVAQFQAFKVYEDIEIEKELRERQKRNRHKDDLSNIYKGTDEDRFVTKKEAKERLKVQEVAGLSAFEPRSPLATPKDQDSPMSVEKSVMDEHDTCSIIAKSKTCRDTFFEMAEYRNEIFIYLKEQEVIWLFVPFFINLIYYFFVVETTSSKANVHEETT